MSVLTASLRHWPRRRWVAMIVFLPAMALLFGRWAGATAGPLTWWRPPVLVGTTILAGLIFASYLPAPGSGRLLEIGCSPCAVAAVAAVGFALMIRASAPADGALAGLSLMVLAAGLAQRLKDARTCAT